MVKMLNLLKRTKISCDKNHVNDVTSAGKVIMTAHGFIDDTKPAPPFPATFAVPCVAVPTVGTTL